MTSFHILVTEPLGDEGLALLREDPRFHVEVALGLSHAQLIEKIANFDALLVRSQTDVNKELIFAGKKLKLIGRAGVGTDNIDLSAAKETHIAVINTPSGNSLSTAEFTFALMLCAARQIPAGQQHLLAGLWQRSKFKGFELAGKTLGIIGLGNVGRILAERARAFQMKVIAFDPVVEETVFSSMGIKKCGFEELLSHSDILSLHCGLNAQTKHLINATTLALMKKGSWLINAARGELIEPNALIEALDQGHLAGAAMDVYAVEPPLKDDPLVHHPKIIATPHLAASTEEAQRRVSTLLAEQCTVFFKGGTPSGRVV